MRGIEREIDAIGRVVIPIEYRRRLGVTANSRVIVAFSDEEVRISAVNRHCALCMANIDSREIRLCDKCIEKVKSLEN